MSDWPIRLRVEMDGASRADLITRLDAQAAQFFGDTPYRLSGDVDVEVLEVVRSIGGQTTLLTWSGVAIFETLP